jgi:hypothetical protein
VLEGMDPPRQITSRSLPDRLLAATYTLEEEKDGTRVTVKMTGFEALPDDARHDRLHVSGPESLRHRRGATLSSGIRSAAVRLLARG